MVCLYQAVVGIMLLDRMPLISQRQRVSPALLIILALWVSRVIYLVTINIDIIDCGDDCGHAVLGNDKTHDGDDQQQQHPPWAAICTVAGKDEERYIEEWMDYHLGLGFGHIYIYDNDPMNSLSRWNGYRLQTTTDSAVHSSHSATTASPLPSSSVTVIPSSIMDDRIQKPDPWHTIFGTKQLLLLNVCADMLRKLRPNPPRWVMMTDVDEFLVIKKNYSDVTSFLTNELPEGAMRLPWLNFGTSTGNSSNNDVHEPVTKRFRYYIEEPRIESKTLAVLDHVESFSVHFPKMKMGFPLKVKATWAQPAPHTYVHGGDYSDVALHHYRYKSRQEYFERRCSPLGPGKPERIWWYNCSQDVYVEPGTVYDDGAWEMLKRNVPLKYGNDDKMQTSNHRSSGTEPSLLQQPHQRTPTNFTEQHRREEPTILIAVATARKNLDSRVMTILRTWGEKLPPNVHLHFFLGEYTSVPSEMGDERDLNARVGIVSPSNSTNNGQNQQRIRVMKAVVDDEYPPVYKHNKLLEYAAATSMGNVKSDSTKFDFIFKVDDDTFVNVEALTTFVQDKDPMEHHYWGEPAFGATEDRFEMAKLGLVKPYCTGGPGYVLSQATIQAIAPLMPGCVRPVDISPYRKHVFHDDTILGICIQKEIGIGCGNDDPLYNSIPLKELPFRPIFGDFKRSYHLLGAVSAHPFKKSEAMVRVHTFFQISTNSMFGRLLQGRCLEKKGATYTLANEACRKCMSQPGASCQTCGEECVCFCQVLCTKRTASRNERTLIVRPTVYSLGQTTRFIPRIVHQTWYESMDPLKYPEKYPLIQSFKQAGWEYRFYTDDDARGFIQKHFSKEVLQAFDALIPGAFKADLFRYCVLLITGGVYADTDVLMKTDLEAAIPPDVGFMVPLDSPGVESGHNSCLWNGFMASAPGHPVLARVIELVVNQVRKRSTSVDFELDMCSSPDLWMVIDKWKVLFLTGPCALGSAMNQLLGNGPQERFLPGEIITQAGSALATFSTTTGPPVPPRIVLLDHNSDWVKEGIQNFVVPETNLTVAAANIGGWKRDKATKLHYSDTPGANDAWIWGLNGVYKDLAQVDENIRIAIAMD